MAQQSPFKTLRRLLTPSGFGVIVYIFLMGLIIFLRQITSIKQYLEVPKDFSFFRIVTGGVDHALTRIIGEGRTEVLVVGLFWAIVGLAVYGFLFGVSRFITDFSAGMDEREYLWPKGVDRNRGVVQALRKAGFQTLAFIGAIVWFFGPVQRVFSGPLWVDFIGQYQTVRLAVWFIAGCLVLHGFVVLLRLIALKPRLFD